MNTGMLYTLTLKFFVLLSPYAFSAYCRLSIKFLFFPVVARHIYLQLQRNIKASPIQIENAILNDKVGLHKTQADHHAVHLSHYSFNADYKKFLGVEINLLMQD